MKKSEALVDQDYNWESSCDIEGDVNWAVDSLIDEWPNGEFPGTLSVVVTWSKEEVE